MMKFLVKRILVFFIINLLLFSIYSLSIETSDTISIIYLYSAFTFCLFGFPMIVILQTATFKNYSNLLSVVRYPTYKKNYYKALNLDILLVFIFLGISNFGYISVATILNLQVMPSDFFVSLEIILWSVSFTIIKYTLMTIIKNQNTTYMYIMLIIVSLVIIDQFILSFYINIYNIPMLVIFCVINYTLIMFINEKELEAIYNA